MYKINLFIHEETQEVSERYSKEVPLPYITEPVKFPLLLSLLDNLVLI
jgi:hypothetical protein